MAIPDVFQCGQCSFLWRTEENNVPDSCPECKSARVSPAPDEVAHRFKNDEFSRRLQQYLKDLKKGN